MKYRSLFFAVVLLISVLNSAHAMGKKRQALTFFDELDFKCSTGTYRRGSDLRSQISITLHVNFKNKQVSYEAIEKTETVADLPSYNDSQTFNTVKEVVRLPVGSAHWKDLMRWYGMSKEESKAAKSFIHIAVPQNAVVTIQDGGLTIFFDKENNFVASYVNAFVGLEAPGFFKEVPCIPHEYKSSP